MNSVVLLGRLTDNVRISYRKEDHLAIARFILAVERPMYREKRDQAIEAKKPHTDFIKIKARGSLALDLYKYTGKGDRIALEGHLTTSSYKYKGRLIYTSQVLVRRIDFLDYKSEDKANKYMEMMVKGWTIHEEENNDYKEEK